MKPAPLLDRIDALVREHDRQVIADVEAWLDETEMDRLTSEGAELDYETWEHHADRRRGEIADFRFDHACAEDCQPADTRLHEWTTWQWDHALVQLASDWTPDAIDPCGWRTVAAVPA